MTQSTFFREAFGKILAFSSQDLSLCPTCSPWLGIGSGELTIGFNIGARNCISVLANIVFFRGLLVFSKGWFRSALNPAYDRRLNHSCFLNCNYSTLTFHHESRSNPCLLISPEKYIFANSNRQTRSNFGIERSLQFSATSFNNIVLCSSMLIGVANRGDSRRTFMHELE